MTQRATLPHGVATGVGSMPGNDFVDLIRYVFEEFGDYPHLPEAPDRGAGAEMIGRTAGLLVDLPTEVYVGGWRLTPRGGADARRTADLWARDLDALHEVASDHDGPFKIQLVGPWSMAAMLGRRSGGVVLRDEGAVRDLAASLAEGVTQHVAAVRERIPSAQLTVQIDEPSLPAVLAGEVPTESGFGRLPAIDFTVVQEALGSVIKAAGVPVVVHCCAAQVPVALIRSAGAAGVSLDLSLISTSAELDALGEAVDADVRLFAGVVPTLPLAVLPVTRMAADAIGQVVDLWRRWGFDRDWLPQRVVITPTCGLAGAPRDYVAPALAATRTAAQRLWP